MKDSVRCTCKMAQNKNGCKIICSISDKFIWNSQTKLCQIKEEFRYMLKETK